MKFDQIGAFKEVADTVEVQAGRDWSVSKCGEVDPPPAS